MKVSIVGVPLASVLVIYIKNLVCRLYAVASVQKSDECARKRGKYSEARMSIYRYRE